MCESERASYHPCAGSGGVIIIRGEGPPRLPSLAPSLPPMTRSGKGKKAFQSFIVDREKEEREKGTRDPAQASIGHGPCGEIRK